jgi:hypothetical protein
MTVAHAGLHADSGLPARLRPAGKYPELTDIFMSTGSIRDVFFMLEIAAILFIPLSAIYTGAKILLFFDKQNKNVKINRVGASGLVFFTDGTPVFPVAERLAEGLPPPFPEAGNPCAGQGCGPFPGGRADGLSRRRNGSPRAVKTVPFFFSIFSGFIPFAPKIKKNRWNVFRFIRPCIVETGRAPSLHPYRFRHPDVPGRELFMGDRESQLFHFNRRRPFFSREISYLCRS